LKARDRARQDPSPTRGPKSPSQRLDIVHDRVDDNDDRYSDVQELFFNQRLDHFASHPCQSSVNGTDCDTGNSPLSFKQRYFYSDRFVRVQSPASIIDTKKSQKL